MSVSTSILKDAFLQSTLREIKEIESHCSTSIYASKEFKNKISSIVKGKESHRAHSLPRKAIFAIIAVAVLCFSILLCTSATDGSIGGFFVSSGENYVVFQGDIYTTEYKDELEIFTPTFFEENGFKRYTHIVDEHSIDTTWVRGKTKMKFYQATQPINPSVGTTYCPYYTKMVGDSVVHCVDRKRGYYTLWVANGYCFQLSVDGTDITWEEIEGIILSTQE